MDSFARSQNSGSTELLIGSPFSIFQFHISHEFQKASSREHAKTVPTASSISPTPRAMLNLERYRMTTGNKPVRSAYGRAGFKPRRKRMRSRPPSACAVSPAQRAPSAAEGSPPYGVAFRAFRRLALATHHSSLATEFLLATLLRVGIELTYSKHARYENPSSNKIALSGNAPSGRPPRQAKRTSEEAAG